MPYRRVNRQCPVRQWGYALPAALVALRLSNRDHGHDFFIRPDSGSQDKTETTTKYRYDKFGNVLDTTVEVEKQERWCSSRGLSKDDRECLWGPW